MSNYNKKKEPNKHVGFRIDPKVEAEIDRGTELSHAGSRSAFVEKAVKHYLAYLDGEKTDAEKILTTVRFFEKHMASILFKIAGEQAMIELMFADSFTNLTHETIRWYRNAAYNIVRKRKGVVSFADVYDEAQEMDRETYYENGGGDD